MVQSLPHGNGKFFRPKKPVTWISGQNGCIRTPGNGAKPVFVVVFFSGIGEKVCRIRFVAKD